MELTVAQMQAVLQAAGAESVDEAAAEELAAVLENYMGYIAEEAVAQARDNERGHVAREDVVAAEEE